MLFQFDDYFQAPTERPLLSQHEIQALVMHLSRGTEILAIEPLSGGFRNQNYRIEHPQGQAVLRVASETQSALKELNLMQRLSQFLPVPKVLAERQTSAHVFALLEFIEGQRADTLPHNLSEASLLSLGAAIGATLAKIHQIQFPATGFLDSELKIPDPLTHLGDSWLAYMREVLHGKRAEQRLGRETCQESLQMLNRNEYLLRDLEPVQRLVHSDFNLKNLLVREKDGYWQVRAVLDWEFAHSGSPLVDFGNFFRFEKELPQALFEGFLHAYQELNGPLGPLWRKQAKLLDLTSMCNFLDAPEERPITLKTVRKIFAETLESLA
ncbi:hypothetical protein COW36_05405 [bacterium (Candidatus Blackallbacteria) CG17_big_fil_post_rev_8_21_14_2_50_48_46]|uniref:Aminoglycoside phosphotransferase domain-containing protein n=1 Tax=bacterium (Candidatus Blackallbacteria) CG17_big_fil_post_rev_8_21_14_2_50_48_46 TaxID=2014261 RepID=A0A2M7G7Y6_9BACT|nr:MAG: hypothetical protein COW64_21000 [bacterium (Candidatus Blackallbacteria) CG18_big_fil_WC_8_21_14_2_50_49_26]PIW18205.1 MAG: hypothetical protein COW36_05405 [bacterium (Candidatus Blackallbacteria) CG17_big_fil_post_rev_8_21_14_2_50_48_46]PIW50636.1 MAG: hypothetical protein COW20_01670 [bacterium (Candidatus Blackallbacteria) CG13_big_fil_rev_8_21_14_2_50_49_14]